jgi:hypothetical protein
MPTKRTRRTKDSPDYVNNKEFTAAVHEYVQQCHQCDADSEDIPIISNYIAKCFVEIANRLSKKSNFNGYTYKDEMVADAIENCVKAIRNYNLEAATRSGNPNAFGYFTQICYYAFLRRIQKEQKQWNIKEKYRDESGIDEFADCSATHGSMSEGMAERMKSKMNFYREDRSLHKEEKNDDKIFEENE